MHDGAAGRPDESLLVFGGALRVSRFRSLVRFGRMAVRLLRVLVSGRVVALLVMLRRRFVRLRSGLVMLGGFVMSGVRHDVLLCRDAHGINSLRRPQLASCDRPRRYLACCLVRMYQKSRLFRTLRIDASSAVATSWFSFAVGLPGLLRSTSLRDLAVADDLANALL